MATGVRFMTVQSDGNRLLEAARVRVGELRDGLGTQVSADGATSGGDERVA